MDHLGVEVASTEEVSAAAQRLAAEGVATTIEEDTACCYAVQDMPVPRSRGIGVAER